MTDLPREQVTWEMIIEAARNRWGRDRSYELQLDQSWCDDEPQNSDVILYVYANTGRHPNDCLLNEIAPTFPELLALITNGAPDAK